MIRPVLAAVLFGPLVLAAPSGVRRPETKAHLVLVKMKDVSPTEYRFEPSTLTVQPGDTLRFEQTTTMPHNVQFKDVAPGANLGAAMTGDYLVTAGQAYDLVIDGRFTAGTYHFACAPHEAMGMKGTLTVSGGSAPAAASR